MSNELATTSTNVTAMAAISAVAYGEPGGVFCSIKQDGDRKSAAKVYNALNNPSGRVADMINKTIPVQDFLVELREIINEETGEIDRVPRVVLITPDGEGYQAVSKGIFGAVRNAVASFGEAPWVPPLDMEIKQIPTKNGSMLTADVVVK